MSFGTRRRPRCCDQAPPSTPSAPCCDMKASRPRQFTRRSTWQCSARWLSRGREMSDDHDRACGTLRRAEAASRVQVPYAILGCPGVRAARHGPRGPVRAERPRHRVGGEDVLGSLCKGEAPAAARLRALAAGGGRTPRSAASACPGPSAESAARSVHSHAGGNRAADGRRLELPPTGTITPHTFRFAIGLIATTGLRRSEAVSLRLSDITADGLVVRETKYRKSRLVVLHDSTWRALERYLERRNGRRATDDHLLVLRTGRPPSAVHLSATFRRLARETGLRGGKGEPGPTLHSLRHVFAVRSLERAHLPDRDSVSRHMLALSTYLGHGSVADTFWYLEATPTLLNSIASAAEDAFTGRASK